MAASAHDLEAQVLSLSPQERVRMLESLIASFEPRSACEAAWVREVQRRRSDVRSGKASMVPGAEALARVRARIS